MMLISNRSLKVKAVFATACIILLVLAVNTFVNIAVTKGRYREALIARSAAAADDVRRDIVKAAGFGVELGSLIGMDDRLKVMAAEDPDISMAMVIDMNGKVLYANDPSLRNKVLADPVTKKTLAAGQPLVHSYSNEAGGHIEKAMPLIGPDNKQVGVFRLALKESAVSKQTRSLLLWSLVVAFISFVAATGMVYLFIDRSITKPITEQVRIASSMAAGDLRLEITESEKTEIGSLGTAINAMSSNLRGMLGKIKQIGASVGEAMTLMSGATVKISRGARVQQEATEQTATTVTEMSASIKSVAQNAEEMAAAATNASSSAAEMASSVEEVARSVVGLSSSAEDTAGSIGQMISSIKQVSENTELLAASAEQTSASITEMSSTVKEVEQRALESARLAEKVSTEASERGMTAVREAIRGMQNIRETVEATADVVNRLGKRSQQIGQILKVIDEVTDQTSLLALNAAILAAQAGERGKGFAVVADEIKDLAERTAASTQEISDLIAAVREETEQSVLAMARGLKAVESGAILVNETNDVLQQVADSSRHSAEMARAIERTTAEQARGIAQITEASVSVAGQIEQIARAMQEQRRGSEQIAEAVEQMRLITRLVKNATMEQTTGSRQIAAAVESVKEQAACIARATAEQNLGAQNISTAVNKIQEITLETVDVSVELDMAVQQLAARSRTLQAELEGFKV